MTEIAHYIDNARVAGTSGRQPARFQSGHRRRGKDRARSPRPRRSTAAVAAAAAAWPAWAKTPSLRRARILDRFKTILWERADQLAEVISAEHGKTHDDAKGEVTRGLEVVEFAVGAPHLLKGEITENVGTGVDSHSLRQPLGRGRGHHAVQLPRHGADVDVPGRHRLRQLLYSQAVRARPVAVTADRRMAGRGRAAEGRLQRRSRRQGGGRRAPRTPRRQGGQLRRFDADRALHLPDRHRQRKTGAGARRGEEPHGDHARRRPRHGGQRADGRGLRLGRRALHGDLGGGAGDGRGRRTR